jgi:hypothetical protein
MNNRAFDKLHLASPLVRRGSVALTSLLVAGLLGCDGAQGDAPAASAADEVSAAEAKEPPPPIVSMDLPSGNKISIYEIGGRVLTVEEGVAYTPPALRKMRLPRDGSKLVEMFKTLRPDLPVPERLTALQAQANATNALRATATQPTPSADTTASSSGPIESRSSALSSAPPKHTTGGGPMSSSNGKPTVQTASLVGCNNGCCDPDWTFVDLCGFGGDPQPWPAPPGVGSTFTYYQFNFGWSFADTTQDDWVDATACAAVGTSTQVINGTKFTVAEGHYHMWHWDDVVNCWFPQLCDEQARTYVNTQSTAHQHTACGDAIQD